MRTPLHHNLSIADLVLQTIVSLGYPIKHASLYYDIVDDTAEYLCQRLVW